MCPLGYRCGRSEQHLPGGLSHPLREELGGGGGAEEAEEEGEEGGAAPALRYQGILPHSQQEQQALTHQTKHCQPLQAAMRLFHLCKLLRGGQTGVLFHLCKARHMYCFTYASFYEAASQMMYSFTSASLSEAASQMYFVTSASLAEDARQMY